ncbi:MAG TPA: ABC transporter ATP-binding protein [Bryobacteraceae bacterium]|jgi:ABC-type Fe3+/spermidine/putrescine transport system ATPase subunit|nr:ABC transporter ATP-binding protein [Bryobacteraceae bacterium]
MTKKRIFGEDIIIALEPILELREVTRQHGGRRIVDRISFSVPRGAFYSLLGPSGCGKTTTLRLIAGFDAPSAGEILLSGVRVNERKPYERNVSTVFQSYALFPHLTVQGNVEFGLRRISSPDIGRKVKEALALVELTGKEARYPAQLSGGERQRVALARSLVMDPDVLLLDEPLSALDPKLRKQMRVELKALQSRVGTTFLFVTHDQEEALSMSDSIAVMNGGRIEQIGSPETVYLRPATRFVAGFMGAVNWIRGVGLRPESLRLARLAPNGGPCCAATVTRSVFLGNCLQVHVRLESGEEAVAEVERSSDAFQAGESIHAFWKGADEMVFP